MKTFLTIAGSDPSGGAGIQADMKTAAAFGLYSMSIPTAVTIQNTLGVSGVYELPAEVVKAQLDAVFSDIFPDCVKIGMCVNKEIVSVIAEALEKYRPCNVVLDTILISSSGRQLLPPDAAKLMRERLFKLSDIITPNVPEAEYLTGCKICSEADMEKAASLLYEKHGCAVMLKGGHLNGCDILYDSSVSAFAHQLINNPNTHGTGCTLSSALACSLALGKTAREAAKAASEYVVGAIEDGMDLGHGTGPLNHLYRLFRQPYHPARCPARSHTAHPEL
ncbi:MAG: bifunctional hydroxymethylpyrimidine kinase/phosphomethylpyrimidine kinase [Clostridiales bacterium]|nr:bifunctional hydroxymethylpyrimidine kinase/phosphomethylpyrimidine kinase [Clostridiales bacterium]